MPDFTTSVYLDTHEIIDALEEEGYVVRMINEKTDSEEELNSLEDCVYDLYRDWTSLDGGAFEKKLVKFFSETLNINVVI